MGCHVLLPGTFQTQGLNLWLLMSPALVGGFFTTSATWEALYSIPNSNTTSPGKLSQTPQNLSLFLLHLEHHVYGSQDTLMNILCSQVAVTHWIGTHLA